MIDTQTSPFINITTVVLVFVVAAAHEEDVSLFSVSRGADSAFSVWSMRHSIHNIQKCRRRDIDVYIAFLT